MSNQAELALFEAELPLPSDEQHSLPIGPRGFNTLLRTQLGALEKVHSEMFSLAEAVKQVGATLMLSYQKAEMAPGIVCGRLRWRQRGTNSRKTFPELLPHLRKLPDPLVRYLRECDVRVSELNALESIYRGSAQQAHNFLRHGSIRG